jgi:hypothetical protein
LISVVFPAPRKPVTTVMGQRLGSEFILARGRGVAGGGQEARSCGGKPLDGLGARAVRWEWRRAGGGRFFVPHRRARTPRAAAKDAGGTGADECSSGCGTPRAQETGAGTGRLTGAKRGQGFVVRRVWVLLRGAWPHAARRGMLLG